MNIDYQAALEESKRIIICGGDHSSSFKEYSRGYFVAIECIKEVLKNLDIKIIRALTVLSSGDHVFNLIHAGATTIDAFDINELQYFVYKLRFALILTLSYKDFINVNINFNRSWYRESLYELIKGLKKELPEEVYEYYCKILEYCLQNNCNLSGLYYDTPDYFKRANNYLTSEEEYLLLRKKLLETEVNIHFADVLDIPKIVTPGYDIALLSNIADYLHFNLKSFGRPEFEAYIQSFKGLLNREGALINYIYYIKSNAKNVIASTNDVPKNARISIDYLGNDNIFTIKTEPYCVFDEGYYLVRKKMSTRKK